MKKFPHTGYRGLLCIGDPHLQGRVPGFRKDDYPRVVLNKLAWCFDYASREKLLPAVLGDLFDLPRDNPNWLIVELLQLFENEVVGIYGNHDVRENQMNDHDSLSILAQAGRIQLLTEQNLFYGKFGERNVVIGGTSWGQPFPKSLQFEDDESGRKPLVIWLCHHDLILPGYEEQGKINPDAGPQVDIAINGHIHRRLEISVNQGTTWFTPGNISRRTRSDATKQHVPSTLRIDIEEDGWRHQYIEVPHKPFEDVFHEAITDVSVDKGESAFVKGLAELQGRRTQTGELLTQFLDENLGQFEDDVADEIRKLASEVVSNES